MTLSPNRARAFVEGTATFTPEMEAELVERTKRALWSVGHRAETKNREVTHRDSQSWPQEPSVYVVHAALECVTSLRAQVATLKHERADTHDAIAFVLGALKAATGEDPVVMFVPELLERWRRRGLESAEARLAQTSLEEVMPNAPEGEHVVTGAAHPITTPTAQELVDRALELQAGREAELASDRATILNEEDKS